MYTPDIKGSVGVGGRLARELNPAFPVVRLLRVPDSLEMRSLGGKSWVFAFPQDLTPLFCNYAELQSAVEGIDFFHSNRQLVEQRILSVLRSRVIDYNDTVLRTCSEVPEWLMEDHVPMTDEFRRTLRVYRRMIAENPNMEPSPYIN